MLVGISLRLRRKIPTRRGMGGPDTTVGRREPDNKGRKVYTCYRDTLDRSDEDPFHSSASVASLVLAMH